jgi:RNA polymerase sigma-70 factor (ECF subfamily)
MAIMEMVWALHGPAETVPAIPPREAQLVAASLSGDRDAFSDLVRRHEHRVFRLAGRFFHQRADVEDAAQETFLTAWRRLDTYRSRAPFEHWLTRICLNCCYARLRRSRPELPLSADTPAAAPDPDAALEVRSLLARLRPADRFLLLLLEGEGWSVEEVAQRLGWTRVNVRVRAHRARRRLKAILEEGAGS